MNDATRSSQADGDRGAQAHWARMRQGARNVAGVSWQLSVTAHVLAESYAGSLPFVRATPEGFEDIDCVNTDGSTTLIQVKERNAGDATLTAAHIGDALLHAHATEQSRDVVVVTDARLGSGLVESGWNATAADVSPRETVQAVIDALVKHSVDVAVAAEMVESARVVVLPYRLREHTERVVWNAAGCAPAIAAVAVSELIHLCASKASEQRHTSVDTAGSIDVSDLESIVHRTADVIDPSTLNEAIRTGVCAPADFVPTSEIAASAFYRGLDGSPGLVGAGLDVIRAREMSLCGDALARDGAAVITGPSGSGKSMLMWRAARDLVPAARVVRVIRVADANDAGLLERHVRLARPSEHSPVLVAVDDLGRPGTEAWTDAASRLRELAHVLILGCARAEDFGPRLLVGPTATIEPELDHVTAEAISAGLSEADIEQRMSVAEALADSKGLLMEFIALLTEGRRLDAVLWQQAEELQSPDRAVQLEAARLVTAAHSLGLALDANRLVDEVLRSRGGAVTRDEVGRALAVLHREHIAVTDGDSWWGLHALRSTVLARHLHETPPPSFGDTWERVLRVIRETEVGWFLRRLAEVDPKSASQALEALPPLVAGVGAASAATILEGAERADATDFARASIPALEGLRKPTLSIATLMMFGYARQAGALDSFGNTGPMSSLDELTAKIADALPPRSEYARFTSAACASMEPQWLAAVLRASAPADALRLLEILPQSVEIPSSAISDALGAALESETPEGASVWSRMVAASWSRVPENERPAVFGALEERVKRVVARDQAAVDLEIVESESRILVTRLYPIYFSRTPQFPWDGGAPKEVASLNSDVMALVDGLADAGPELDVIEVVTVTPTGVAYRDASGEPGHKRIPRKNRHQRDVRRKSTGVMAAVARLTTAASHSQVNETIAWAASELNDLLADMPLRMKPYDNAGRQRDWFSRLEAVEARLAGVGTRPSRAAAMVGLTDAAIDAEAREVDRAVEALNAVASSMVRVAQQLRSGALERLVPHAMALRDARTKVVDITSALTLQHGGLDLELVQEAAGRIETMARVLMVAENDPAILRQIDSRDPLRSARGLCADADEERQALLNDFASQWSEEVPTIQVAVIDDPDPPTWHADTRALVFSTPLDGLERLSEYLCSDDAAEIRSLGCRIALLANADGVVSEARGPETVDGARLALGPAYLLSSREPVKAMPLTPDLARPWVTAAQMRDLPERHRGPLDDLIEVSWDAAWTRASNSVASRGDLQLRDRLARAAENVRSWVAKLTVDAEDRAAAHEAVEELIGQVDAEVDGVSEESLVGVYLGIASRPDEIVNTGRLALALSVVGLVAAVQAVYDFVSGSLEVP